MAKADALFFSTDSEKETLYTRIVPTEEQTSFLREKWNTLADWLVEDLRGRSGFSIRTWLQGSYKFGTVIRPVNRSEEYDVDLGVYFLWADGVDATPAPEQLKDWVQASVTAYHQNGGAGTTKVANPPKERCSRVHYEQQFHVDVPAYHLEEAADVRRLATATKGWEPSDPKAIYGWFKDKVGNPERAQLRRIVRYLKAWAAMQFQADAAARPTSVVLTVVATEAFMELDDNAVTGDEDTFCAVVKRVSDRLHERSRVENPVDATEDLNRCAEEDHDRLLVKLKGLEDVCRRALEAENEGAAAVIWDEAFGHLMPLPPEDASIEFVEGDGRAVAALPIIDVDVRDAAGNHLGTYRDEVPRAAKNCSLHFRIVNPGVVPEWATVDWVVRNEGDEAAANNDVGHAWRGKRALTCDEHTAYNGRHFMDCIIRGGGNVLAVKRVPVYVRSPAFTKPLPKKPWYRQFAKRR